MNRVLSLGIQGGGDQTAPPYAQSSVFGSTRLGAVACVRELWSAVSREIPERHRGCASWQALLFPLSGQSHNAMRAMNLLADGGPAAVGHSAAAASRFQVSVGGPFLRSAFFILGGPLILVIGFAAVTVCKGAAPAAQVDPKSRILMLSSFDRSLPGGKMIEHGFYNELNKRGSDYEVFTEYLDVVRFPAEEQRAAFASYLQKRYERAQPRILVTVGDDAFDFLMQRRLSLFSETPVAFIALSKPLLKIAEADQAVTGVPSAPVSGLRTLEAIPQMLPKVREINVISGAAEFDRGFDPSVARAQEELASKVKVNYWAGLPLQEVMRRVQRLSPDEAVFFTSYLRDPSGTVMASADVAKEIVKNSAAPVFGQYETYLGLGVVGGDMLDLAEYGALGGQVVSRLLSGEAPAQIGFVASSPYRFRFDARELSRWGITRASLPPGSAVEFDRKSIWKERPRVMWGILSAILLQTTLIAALLFQRRRLRESEALNRGTLDSLTSLVVILDRAGFVIAVNEAWRQAHTNNSGKTPRIGLGVNYLEVCRAAAADGDASVAKIIAGIELVLRDSTNTFHCEYECATGGQSLWFEMLVLPLHYPKGGAVVKHRDITRHKAIEKELRDHDAKIALAADTANLALWTIDYERGEWWMSENGRNLYGLQPEESLSRQLFLSRVHPGDRTAVEEAIDRARESGETFEIEYRLVPPTGETKWLFTRGRYLKNDRGELSELLGAAIDVTGRKQSEQLFHLAAEASHLGVWDWNEITGELFWDSATREIFDLPPEEKVTLDLFYERIHPHDLEVVKESWRWALESGLTFHLEYRVQRRDGTIRWVDARGRGYYDDKGRAVRMIGVVIDVTAQTNANLELRLQREEMARLNRVTAMGELTASLAHELNQPLTAIASNAAAGRRFLANNSADPEMFAEILADVFSDARRAGEIIHGIHRFVRKSEGSREIVDLNNVIREVLHLLHSDLLGRAVTVESELTSMPANVEADLVQMQQVLLNLIMNSLEAMQETAAPQRRILISTSSSNGSVTASIRDHGPGLPVDHPEGIFTKYYTTKRNGMGMGLTIVRSIVEAHGGEVTAENAGDGARLSFYLPIAYIPQQQEVA